ncbi:MAG: aminotransferase class V-fold PLP-dependent enzyme [Nitrospinota bacterium]|nr:MAG: aminotransferase class V-fold PLP-dependent enzyme [Nitrospinota bacterium]
MTMAQSQSVAGNLYEELGVRIGINARGNQTLLGGSVLAPEVLAAMEQANHAYVEMEELLAKSGEFIAQVLGTEAAYVTSGCAAALALSAAACIAGTDPEKIGRLPDTTGMKDEIVFQKAQQYKYARCLTIPGGKLVAVGDETGCTVEQMEKGIGPQTAAIAYYQKPDWGSNILSLEQVREIAHRKGLPLIVDAASQIYPLDYFRAMAQSGDLVCFGAKYFGAPHSTGIVTGKRELVQAAVAQGFIGFELANQQGLPTPFGRPLKVDRQEVIGVVAALRLWFSIDHEERLRVLRDKMQVIAQAVQDLPGVKVSLPTAPPVGPSYGLRITVDQSVVGKDAATILETLAAGNPPIWVRMYEEDGPDTFAVNVQTLNEGEEQVIAERLKSILAAGA